MKKRYCKLSLVVLVLILKQTSFGQKLTTDTTFFFKDTAGGQLQSIFIDQNRNSKFYENITGFTFGQFDNDTYESSLRFLKERNVKLFKTKLSLFTTKWVELKMYHGNYYAYSPCDFYTYFAHSINDTTFIDWTGEGPIANKILQAKVIDSNTYFLKLTGQYEQERRLIIHIVDKQKGIAVFENINASKVKKYYLMIAAKKIRNVPIIVNYCPYQKQFELEFEKPNFEKLLKIR
ncbi:MAG: hypothetical protein ABIS69_05570 [Sediminibacterium sp.]